MYKTSTVDIEKKHLHDYIQKKTYLIILFVVVSTYMFYFALSPKNWGKDPI